jgi:nucleoside-diphosphate-sugar epimerase
MVYSKILVTGGAGFIGSHLVDRLLDEGFEVWVLDDLSAWGTENIIHRMKDKRFHLVRGDIREVNVIDKIVENVDAVFHLAALVDVNLSIKNPILFNDVNVVGTLNLLKSCLDFNVDKFIFSSSAAVYGDSEQAQKNENMILKPVSPYGVSKFAAERYVQMFNKLYDLQTICLRYFNVYGPNRGFRSNYGGVIIRFINQLLKGESPVIHGDGEQSRDFVHVDDVVSANMLALKKSDAAGKVFNIATGTTTTIYEIAKKLQQTTKTVHLKPIFMEKRLGDIKHCTADISKAEKFLDFHPQVNIEDGLSALVKFRLKQLKANQK